MYDFFFIPCTLVNGTWMWGLQWSSTLDSETSAMCGRWWNKTEWATVLGGVLSPHLMIIELHHLKSPFLHINPLLKI